MMRSFGDTLREARRAKGYTQQRLADHLGVALMDISNAERGQKLMPEAYALRLEKLLGAKLLEALIHDQGYLSLDIYDAAHLTLGATLVRCWDNLQSKQRDVEKALTDAAKPAPIMPVFVRAPAG